MPKVKPRESEQAIETLQDRYRELNEQKIKVQTQRDDAVERLNRIKEEAREKFGTDDIQLLQQKLAEMKRENEQRRVAYQKSLDVIEQRLAELNEDFYDASQEDSDSVG